MTHKTLGVVGGLGLETGQKFCTAIASKVRNATNVQPSIICHIVNLPLTLELDLVYGRVSEEHFSILKESVKSLELAGVDSIAIPCNTVHVFIDRLRCLSNTPIFSIIEETALEIARKDLDTVGILASSTTVDAGLYQKELSKHGIKAIFPTNTDQKIISDLIFNILNGNQIQKNIVDSNKVIQKLEGAGAKAIILGCTDLRLVDLSSKLPIIDSTTVLEETVINYLVGNTNNTTQHL
ncbi:amino acid racemase [Candidatus Micrarchaeota archaeon]|nr:amino acid racemase [Candidatus Micrarchaeota archaeon]MBU1165874.1 amino acid racemase [Candidatus Micrarchaeota archaeon]MBU1886375.1 amino acid racemase [Candidatus Micrarchaeota archaeon]